MNKIENTLVVNWESPVLIIECIEATESLLGFNLGAS